MTMSVLKARPIVINPLLYIIEDFTDYINYSPLSRYRKLVNNRL